MISQFKLNELAVGDPVMSARLAPVGVGANNMLQCVSTHYTESPADTLSFSQVVCGERKTDDRKYQCNRLDWKLLIHFSFFASVCHEERNPPFGMARRDVQRVEGQS